MSLSVGIVGLPNVGKSTLFNALIKKHEALAANYPFATIEPNVGVVDVPDSRLQVLGDLVKTKKIVPALITFYDIAGLVKGAHEGEGLGNKFLDHIRKVDAILHVVRAFNDENVIRAGAVSPKDDIQTINTELILADLDVLLKHIQRLEKLLRTPDKEIPAKLAVLKQLYAALETGELASSVSLTHEEKERIKDIDLLTAKPVLYVLNVDEIKLDYAPDFLLPSDAYVVISAKLEEELIEFSDQERHNYLSDMGQEYTGLDKVIKQGFSLLGLQVFLTAGEQETRAWTINIGDTAYDAAGKIHTDFQRGFICANVLAYKDFIFYKTWKAARDAGVVRTEGKTYIMQDGDVVEFRFNV